MHAVLPVFAFAMVTGVAGTEIVVDGDVWVTPKGSCAKC